MIDFYEKYSDLHVENNSDYKKVLNVIPGENRGDDMCGTMTYDYSHNNLTLFLLLQDTQEDSFIQKYCVRDEDKESQYGYSYDNPKSHVIHTHVSFSETEAKVINMYEV